MQNRKQHGFTLTELIVVIAIIGILAAVLVPSITGYIEKAKRSNDISSVANMNKILGLYMIENDCENLNAADIRNILGSDFTFDASSKNNHFFYNLETKKIELKSLSLNSVLASTPFTGTTLEEIEKNMILLDTLGSELAINLNKLRNIKDIADFTKLKNSMPVELHSHIEQFNPKNTVYLNNYQGVTDTTVSEKNCFIFGDNVRVVTNISNVLINITKSIEIPATISAIEKNAFENVEFTNNSVIIKHSNLAVFGQVKPIPGITETVNKELEEVTIKYLLGNQTGFLKNGTELIGNYNNLSLEIVFGEKKPSSFTVFMKNGLVIVRFFNEDNQLYAYSKINFIIRNI